MNRDESDQREIEKRLLRLGEQMREHVSMAQGVHQQLAQTETSADSRSWFPSTSSLKEMTMMQRLSFSSAAAAVILLAAIWLMTSTASVSLAQVAEKLQKVSAYSVDMEMRASRGGQVQVIGEGRIHWHASGSMRMETTSGADTAQFKQDRVAIMRVDRPGISWDNLAKSYRIEPAKRGRRSPIMLLHKLADFSKDATKNLGEKQIDGKLCTGFEIDLQKVDESVGAGRLTLWVDSVESLPVAATIVMTGAGPGEMVLSNFRWNKAFAKNFFDPQPPKGYTNATPAAKSTDEIVEAITSSLKVFADLNAGAYPRVKVIYGDVTLNKAKELSGYVGELTKEQIREKKYVRILESTKGWATMNQIMANNDDSAYHGLHVTSEDNNKVLFRWKLADGDFQVIYGDLRSELVSKEQLSELESPGAK